MSERGDVTQTRTRRLRWRTSSFSHTGDCVEVAESAGGIVLRNSHRPDAGTLLLTRTQMAAFLTGCKAGDLDDLT
jgi:hypothetical protein